MGTTSLDDRGLCLSSGMRVASFKGHWHWQAGHGRGLAVIAFNSFSKYGSPIA